ncbi:hypothetical protein CXF72_07375 [Psychromonas sp. MB-3u-54]|uniref:DUF748 domain-containing protein n=1 Tax=Psychromonas sp. MB-3u-54 TaxID=2058319 RepID=UPI000C347ADD|nr:DUF748 domain-containing protein [Psychromonas sp. MB-3u-54]PKH03287.1 hypothetical protein CXF72_07375 [Psychromonas sp. MB-3u-54]
MQQIFSRYFYCSPLFWAVLLISSYTIGGFILLPKVINTQLVKQIELNSGWQTEIGKVAFNPYTFTLVIDNVAIKNAQGDQVASFKQYTTDFELRSAIEGAFTFANVELVAPSINLVIDKNGLSNFQQAFQTQADSLAEERSIKQSDSALVKLLFDNIAVSNGVINIVDHSQVNTIEHRIDPLNFKLKSFSTRTKDSGDYQLNIDLGKGQSIAWAGTVGVAPLRSSGSISMVGIKAHKLWEYAPQETPYNLLHGIAHVDANYRFRMTDNTPEFDLFDSIIQLRSLQIARQQDSFIDIKAVKIGPVAFNLAKQTLQIEALEIDAIDLQVERNKQGELTFLAPFAQHSEPVEIEPGSTESASANDFKWSIEHLRINDSQVNITDKLPSVAAQFSIHKINLQLSELNQDLTHALPFNVSYRVDDSAPNSIKGQVSPAPFNIKARVNLKNVALTALQPYINDVAKVNLEQGKLSVAGAVSIALDAQGALHGNFEGGLSIQNFNTSDQILKQRLVGWQALIIDPVKVNFNPLSIVIDKIDLQAPYSRMIITPERSINFAQLMIDHKRDQRPIVEKNTQTTSKDKQPPLALTIGEITLSDGNANFADLSLIPAFATSIENINGKISGLSANNIEQAADVNISGTVNDYGKMLVEGEISPFAGDLYTDINVKFDKIELATLTPYSGRYAGYVIDKGKLSLNLNYKIAQQKLIGKNRLILDQFELGTSVDSQEALDLPIKLAIALFKDSNGIIDISLQTRGDLDNPDFDMKGLILKAFLNVMTKAVTSPFSMIADLAGTNDQQLNAIAFDFGHKSLTTTQQSDLAALAQILIKRPQLILEIHAAVDKEKDGFALKQQQLNDQLGFNEANQEQRIKSMQDLLESLAEADKIKVELLAKTATAAEYEQALYKALVKTQPLSSLALTTLAKQRTRIIQEQLIKRNKVPANQVFVVRPSLDGHAEENKILTFFSLNTQ